MNGSLFDKMRNNVFDTTRTVFGYTATWNSNDGQASYSGLVHLKNPTEEVRLQGVEYNESDWTMEYREDDFEGLFKRANERRDPPEVVVIDGNKYFVKEVIQKFDGATFVAYLKPANDDTV